MRSVILSNSPFAAANAALPSSTSAASSPLPFSVADAMLLTAFATEASVDSVSAPANSGNENKPHIKITAITDRMGTLH